MAGHSTVQAVIAHDIWDVLSNPTEINGFSKRTELRLDWTQES